MDETTSVRQPARERLLAAAEELFYQEGVQSVGIDKVIERAGVAKASLYSNFKGKEDLVRAYLEARFDARRAAIEAKLALHAAPRARLLSVFDAMAEAFAKPNYRGCAFMRATAEMPAEASARQVCDDARGWTRGIFLGLAKEAGAANPDTLARHLLLLYDGAAASAQMDGDAAAAAAAAKAAAVLLIDAACSKRARSLARRRTPYSRARA
ncbi:MAG TPA: helix-turn-helix domain-containing protein [Burkholderiaceae bacterium]|nr:helix-turn-helix domain-containing protein [Burkholderiaceae bacterium]